MTKLSVNINKFATLRNARGGNIPDIIEAAKDCERFGADGITVHPRPDERHIQYKDVLDLKKIVTTEFNIEGYPNEKFMELVLSVKPTQCTLVPDGENVVTSDRGWDTLQHADLLKRIIKTLKDSGIRVSVFVDPIERFVEGAANAGADRIELYTGPFAHDFDTRKDEAIIPYVQAAEYASKIGLGVNAGHDLNLKNLQFFKHRIHSLAEVSIGHALICDAIYLGLENTIQLYQRQLK